MRRAAPGGYLAMNLNVATVWQRYPTRGRHLDFAAPKPEALKAFVPVSLALVRRQQRRRRILVAAARRLIRHALT